MGWLGKTIRLGDKPADELSLEVDSANPLTESMCFLYTPETESPRLTVRTKSFYAMDVMPYGSVTESGVLRPA